MIAHSFQDGLGRLGGRLGRHLFVSGAGLLSFSSVCLMRREETYLEIQNSILLLFAISVVLILAGEAMRAVSHWWATRSSARSWADIRSYKARRAGNRISVETRCAFCGKGAEGAYPSAFARCLGCGKTVCARCSALKGKEMDRNSGRCPECGSQVY